MQAVLWKYKLFQLTYSLCQKKIYFWSPKHVWSGKQRQPIFSSVFLLANVCWYHVIWQCFFFYLHITLLCLQLYFQCVARKRMKFNLFLLCTQILTALAVLPFSESWSDCRDQDRFQFCTIISTFSQKFKSIWEVTSSEWIHSHNRYINKNACITVRESTAQVSFY